MADIFQKILVAIDRSPASELVFTKALALAEVSQATLILLCAIEPDYTVSYINPPIYPGSETFTLNEAVMKIYLENQERERLAGLTFLQGLIDRASAVGIVAEINQPLGDPSRSICDVAKTQAVDLIIVGRRGHQGLNELLLGSVSNYVLHHAPCSVLTIQG
jgi:nucleotide-binding universal stress UspA family protein